MIRNRPAELLALPYYEGLPNRALRMDFDAVPELLRLDLDWLVGLQPITTAISDLCPEGIPPVPPPAVVDYHRARGTRFQLVFIVLNLYDYRQVGDDLVAKPFSISLVPATKREQPEECAVELAAKLAESPIPHQPTVYLGFNPFERHFELFGPVSVFMREDGIRGFTDLHGFVVGGYFVALDADEQDVLMPNLVTAPREVQEAYHRHRVRAFLRPFRDRRPRRVWGADSPIELFLLQGLGARGLYPDIQSRIYRDGSVFPCLHSMWLDQEVRPEADLVTDADFFFREQRLAVFCDSTRHHRGARAKTKDARISRELEALGIRVLRVQGRDIVGRLPACVDQVQQALGGQRL